MKGSLDHFGDAFCNCVPPSRLVCFSKQHGLWMSLDASRYEFWGGAAFVVLKTTSMVPTLVKTASFLGSSTTNIEPLDQG